MNALWNIEDRQAMQAGDKINFSKTGHFKGNFITECAAMVPFDSV